MSQEVNNDADHYDAEELDDIWARLHLGFGATGADQETRLAAYHVTADEYPQLRHLCLDEITRLTTEAKPDGLAVPMLFEPVQGEIPF